MYAALVGSDFVFSGILVEFPLLRSACHLGGKVS